MPRSVTRGGGVVGDAPRAVIAGARACRRCAGTSAASLNWAAQSKATQSICAAIQRHIPPEARQKAMFTFMCVVWGTNWLAMKSGVAVVPPGVFAGLRWTGAGLALLAWRLMWGHRPKPSRGLIVRMVLIALLLISVSQVIQLYGVRHVNAGLAAVLSFSLAPVALLGFSALLGREHLTWCRVAGIALGVGGIAVLFGPKAMTEGLDLIETVGAIGVVAATIRSGLCCWAPFCAKSRQRTSSGLPTCPVAPYC